MEIGSGWVCVEIAVRAEEAAVGGGGGAAEDGSGGSAAGVAEEGAVVAGGDGVGGMDVAVAAEAEASGVRLAVHDSRRLAVEITAGECRQRSRSAAENFFEERE